MALAIETGIPASVWAEEGEQAVLTAVELLKAKNGGPTTDEDGRQTSG